MKYLAALRNPDFAPKQIEIIQPLPSEAKCEPAGVPLHMVGLIVLVVILVTVFAQAALRNRKNISKRKIMEILPPPGTKFPKKPQK